MYGLRTQFSKCFSLFKLKMILYFKLSALPSDSLMANHPLMMPSPFEPHLGSLQPGLHSHVRPLDHLLRVAARLACVFLEVCSG